MSFLTPIDISNRALDHVGGEPIDPTLGFTEVSKRAAICGRVYDKLRRAELRRNVWTFATKRAILRALDANTMLLTPALWSSSATYFVGSIVADETGQPWVSNTPSNLNNQPEASSTWDQYCGPMAAQLYVSGTDYFAGEVVYTTAGDGTNRVYISLQNANSDTPATPSAWDATAVYSKNQVVTYSSVAYMSLIDLNTNQQPNLAPALFNIATTYAAGNKVGASDGLIYTSIGSGNVGHDPAFDGGVHWSTAGVLNPWTSVFVGGSGSVKWLQIGGAEFPFGVTLRTINLIYPIGSGPSTQSATRNVFRLPASHLKSAPQDPKAGSSSYLGSPTGLIYNDWIFEGPYIVSSDAGPILYRFVADTVDVPSMDDMFCEGLAARMGLEICEPLTQSSDKLRTIAGIYEKHMGDARLINAIEQGSTEPPMDDYLAVRL